jgi:hypothetical protein
MKRLLLLISAVAVAGMANAQSVVINQFPPQTVGTTSAPLKFVVKNYQAVGLTVTSVALQGSETGDFAQTNNCVPSVAPNGSCTISVTFTPTTTGYRHAGLFIYDNASGSPQNVPLNGFGQ